MRLIDADALLENYDLKNATKYGNETKEQQENSYSTLMLYEVADLIHDAPTVKPVRGKWLYNGFNNEWECSHCHSQIALSDDRNAHPNFCSNCGADMRGEKND